MSPLSFGSGRGTGKKSWSEEGVVPGFLVPTFLPPFEEVKEQAEGLGLSLAQVHAGYEVIQPEAALTAKGASSTRKVFATLELAEAEVLRHAPGV
jgi:hypothetical protein